MGTIRGRFHCTGFLLPVRVICLSAGTQDASVPSGIQLEGFGGSFGQHGQHENSPALAGMYGESQSALPQVGSQEEEMKSTGGRSTSKDFQTTSFPLMPL